VPSIQGGNSHEGFQVQQALFAPARALVCELHDAKNSYWPNCLRSSSTALRRTSADRSRQYSQVSLAWRNSLRL
jgi:hypothetical protein